MYLYMKIVSKTIAYVNIYKCSVVSFHSYRADSFGPDVISFHSWLLPAVEMTFGNTSFLRDTLHLSGCEPGIV